MQILLIYAGQCLYVNSTNANKIAVEGICAIRDFSSVTFDVIIASRRQAEELDGRQSPN